MAGVVAEVLKQVGNYERHKGLRERGRRASSQETFEAIVTAVVCDLTYRYLANRAHGVAITRSKTRLGKRWRYKPPVETEALPKVLDYLASRELDFIVQKVGEGVPGAAKSTTIKPGPCLIRRIREFDVGDVARVNGGETVELRAEKLRDDVPGELLDYQDDETTERYRSELRQINEWLAKADIEFDELAAHDKIVDSKDRWLRRIFNNGSFHEGGRLYGGFWQSLTKRERAEGIIIDDEAVTALDYGQMTPRILYGMVGAKPSCDDLYQVPGLENCRDGVKKVLNAVLFSDKALSRKPKGTRALLPKDDFRSILTRIEAFHLPIAPLFGTAVGLQAQFTESQILVKVLLDLAGKGVVALPIHDAIVVKQSAAQEAEDVMKTIFREMTGVDGLVSRDGIEHVGSGS
jgi:hypothetical protein